MCSRQGKGLSSAVDLEQINSCLLLLSKTESSNVKLLLIVQARLSSLLRLLSSGLVTAAQPAKIYFATRREKMGLS